MGAALTTTGRTGTARRCGSGKRDRKVDERNQCLKPRNCTDGSNLADLRSVAQAEMPRDLSSVLLRLTDDCRSRRFGIGFVRAAVKIVLEPVFEADMRGAASGLAPRSQLVETDTANCLEAIPVDALMQAVEARVCKQSLLKLLRACQRS